MEAAGTSGQSQILDQSAEVGRIFAQPRTRIAEAFVHGHGGINARRPCSGRDLGQIAHMIVHHGGSDPLHHLAGQRSRTFLTARAVKDQIGNTRLHGFPIRPGQRNIRQPPPRGKLPHRIGQNSVE